MANVLREGVRVSQTSPAFLHTNSTSHKFAFGAIAELIDNAYDPDVNASQLKIDVCVISSTTCLSFTDNGRGMVPEKLHRMLSLGYCEKVAINGHKPVGMYGNGFKSGSMRLGKDAIVFTKSPRSFSAGFLSQTYLAAINAETVLVPIITWDRDTHRIQKAEDAAGSLQAITAHSLFKTEEELRLQFEAITSETGTHIIVYNLKQTSDGNFELDFESRSNDILNTEHMEVDLAMGPRPVREYLPEYQLSLREYCSILYLKPRMKIMLKGHKVKTKLVSKSLSKTENDKYTPRHLETPVKIIFGFTPSKKDYGLMMYHRNRLIKAFERVGVQKQGSDQGVSVVGVVEVDFLEPNHVKQDFNKNDRYNACVAALGQKLKDYWLTKSDSGNKEVNSESPDWTWVQCDSCLKWRRLPEGFTDDELPDKWFCYMNPDSTHNLCKVTEEQEDKDEVRVTYQKAPKKPKLKAINQEMEEREREILKREENLKRQTLILQKRLQTQAVPFPAAAAAPVPVLDAEGRRCLDEAQRRVQDQQRVIERLRRQSRALERDRELALQNAMVAAQRTAPTQEASNTQSASTPGALRKARRRSTVALAGGDFVVTRNETDSDSSEDEAARPPAKRKRVSPATNAHQPIMIPSDDDDVGDSRDPDTTDHKDPDTGDLKAEDTRDTDQGHPKARGKENGHSDPGDPDTGDPDGGVGGAKRTGRRVSKGKPDDASAGTPAGNDVTPDATAVKTEPEVDVSSNDDLASPSKGSANTDLSDVTRNDNDVTGSGGEDVKPGVNEIGGEVLKVKTKGTPRKSKTVSPGGTTKGVKRHKTKCVHRGCQTSPVRGEGHGEGRSTGSALDTKEVRPEISLMPGNAEVKTEGDLEESKIVKPDVASATGGSCEANSACAAHVSATAELRSELESTRASLNRLRGNVVDLLKSVIPDVQIKNLADVDDLTRDIASVMCAEGDSPPPSAHATPAATPAATPPATPPPRPPPLAPRPPPLAPRPLPLAPRLPPFAPRPPLHRQERVRRRGAPPSADACP